MAEKLPSAANLRTMSEPDLTQQVAQLRHTLWQDRVKAKEGSLQQSHRLPMMRRQIARLHTVLRERQRLAAAKERV